MTPPNRSSVWIRPTASVIPPAQGRGATNPAAVLRRAATSGPIPASGGTKQLRMVLEDLAAHGLLQWTPDGYIITDDGSAAIA